MIYTDQLGRRIHIHFPPCRIISLVPSQTELLFDLGLEEEVIGITKFCVHPAEWFKTKTRVGGTKKLNLELIRELKPDLIFANKEENDKEQLEILMNEFPVWISEIYTLKDALNMIRSIGEITNRKEKASEIIHNIEKAFQLLKTKIHTPKIPINCAYFIWKDPWMVVGNKTFIHEMLAHLGLNNCFGHLSRYPQITLDQLETTQCHVVFFSSEPFPFKESHVKEIRERFPEMKIFFVDGEMFSWYGSRLMKAPEYFIDIMKSIVGI